MMRLFGVSLIVLCLAGTGFAAETLTGGTLNVDSFGTMVDPVPQLQDFNAATYSVPAMTKDDFNALAGLKVIQFVPTVQFQKVTSIVANYDGVNTATFGNFGDPVGYNYGGGTSAGRMAHSGVNAMDQVGTVQGVAGGTYHGDAVANPALNWFRASIAVSQPGAGVSAIGFIVDGRDDQSTLDGNVWVMFNDASEVALPYTQFGAVAGSGLFFGYQAPAGKFITGIEGSRNDAGGSSYLALDDLAFVVTPEPATLVLLALGGLAAVRRRHA